MTTNNADTQDKQKKKKLFIVVALIVLLALSLVCLLVWQGLRPPEMSKTQESPQLLQVSGTLKTGKDLFLRSSGGDISVLIPACAIQQKGTIVLTPRGAYVPATDEEPDLTWTRPRTALVEYIDQKNNVIPNMYVACPIKVCFVLTTEEWQRYLKSNGDFQIQYLDHSLQPAFWVTLDKIVNASSHELCGEYSQLGLFALAVKGLPVPETGDLYSPVGPVEATVVPTQSGIYEP